MRALGYACLLASWALVAGCCSAPTSEDWLAVGYRTPEQTFLAFQTGLRADLPELEYRCLGADLKHRIGGSLLAYVEFRRELFSHQPLLKLACKAKIQRVEKLGPERVRVVAKVDTWFHDETFSVELVREDFYEIYVDGKRAADDFADWQRIARERDGKLVVSVPLPEGMKTEEIGELRVGSEWKIDGFPLDPEAGEMVP